MSKLHLINEIQTAIKMANSDESLDSVKLAHYLDDLLSNYAIEQRDDLDMIITSDNYLRMYLESLRVCNYSQHTIDNYGYQLAAFSQFIGEKSLLKVKTSDVRTYLAANEHLMPSTIVNKLEIISSFYSWLVSEDELLKNPCDKVKRPKLPKKVRSGLGIIELEKLRNACQDARQRALVEVFYSTGCRLDEIRKIDISDLDWQTSSLIVTGKGDKQRRVYLSEKAGYYLKIYLDSRDDDCSALIASARKPIRRLTREAIRDIIKKIAESTDIDRSVFPHLLRHTFAQLSLDAGMELSDLQALMGHESSSTTLRYAQASEERKQNAFKRFHQQ